MHDPTSENASDHELKFSREQGFFDKSVVVSVLIGIIFTSVLFLFLHFREVRVEVLELNSVAPGYIVAQTDFDFPDEEATSISKQEAVQDVGKIFRLNDKQIRQRHMEFENFLIYNQEWRKYVESSTYEMMYTGADAVEKAMHQIRFTDAITLQLMKEVQIPTNNYVIYLPVDVSREIAIPQQAWRYIKTVAMPAPFFDEAAAFIITYFQGYEWKIDEDIPVQKLLRQKIQSLVATKITHVNAGSRIIDQGERMTPRHIAMLQAMKMELNEQRNLWSPVKIAGSFLLALLLTIICVVYFYKNQPHLLQSNRKLALIATILILTLFIAKITEIALLGSNAYVRELVRYPVFIAFAAILLCSLLNAHVATFAAGFLTVVMTVALSFERQGFMLINLTAALIAILTTRSLSHRKEIFVICAKAWVGCVAMILTLNFSQNILWSTGMMGDIMSSGVSLLLTGIAVIGLLPLLESTFHVMTDVTLMEYMDPNNDLLRRLSIEAAGTYQHSIVVGNIAEAAAVAIGANGLFCRVATLYHDIGKMVTPQYFTENQHTGSVNIHQLLTPAESAAVIIAHVSEGVFLARKAGLPEPFIDIIKEHHGTALVYYFYRKEIERMKGDVSKVNEEDFRYDGPKPRSKESGIIMIADTLEAASRSLEVLDEKNLAELATRLVREKIQDGQLDHCLLTLEELAVVLSTLVHTLVAFSHTRVKYPNRDVRREHPLNLPV